MTEHDEGRRSISLQVEVPGTPQQVWEAIATGPGISAWFVPSQVDNLRLYLNHFRGRPSAAVSLAGGAPEAKALAWAAMLGVLGLTAPIAGARVRTAEASGAPALTGIVERAGDEELLIRTSDTLTGLAIFEWDGRTTTVFRAACFGPDPEALATREAEVWGAWMHQHFPSQVTAVEAHG